MPLYTAEEWRKEEARRRLIRNSRARERKLLYRCRNTNRERFRRDTHAQTELRRLRTLFGKLGIPFHSLLEAEFIHSYVASVMES